MGMVKNPGSISQNVQILSSKRLQKWLIIKKMYIIQIDRTYQYYPILPQPLPL